MADLHLPLKAEYFDQIKAGIKPFEWRDITDYWTKRLVGRVYENVIFKRGYPNKDDASRQVKMPYRGYEIQTITHPHFGPEPVTVYAIHSAQQ
jgi:hypothetical protein